MSLTYHATRGTQADTLLSTSDAASTSDDHKNEGFLKSVWHKLTDNPAHSTKDQETSTSSKVDSPKADEGSKDKEGKKDTSGTGI